MKIQMSDNNHTILLARLKRVMDSLMTLAMGDAYGVGFEFMDAHQIQATYPTLPECSIGGGPFGFSPGQFSDDTEMAALTLYSLHRNHNVDEADLKNLYTAWAHIALDVGIQTHKALVENKLDYHGEGNGALMRIIPSAVYMKEVLNWGMQKIHIECERISSITHNNYTVHAINRLFIDLLLDEPLNHHKEIISLFESTNGTNGWVLNSARIVYQALQSNFHIMDGFKYIVAQGGDTDTHCSIYGAIRGYRDGVENQRVKELLNCHSIARLNTLLTEEIFESDDVITDAIRIHVRSEYEAYVDV